MSAWTQLKEPGPALLILVLAVTSPIVSGAPVDDLEQQSSEIEYYPVADATGCYYNFEHYDEGDRIITNEPCLNCTCHNRMLMCYLRVCPFTKAIGQDCKVEKKPDQCCPVITCPEVPVHLLPSDSTTPSTALGHLNEYGCSIDNLFYADGAKVPSNPNNPCEVCYCIRNKTACIIQECTLTGKVVEGCSPVYVDGVCCPVRYDCDHPELETTPRPLLTTTTTTLPPTTAPTDCIYHNEVYADGALVKKDVPCEQCYCMRGDIVCAVQECGPTPLDKVNCTALPAKKGQCCPDTYECDNISEKDLTTLTYYEAPTTQPTEIVSNESSTPSEVEGLTTTIQGKEQPSLEVTEAIAQGTEDISATQPVTESATVETFTSRITEAVDAITSKVTEIVEAFTSAVSRSDQETTALPDIQTTESELSGATEKSQTVDQQTATESEVEEGTKPEIIVTEKTSQETVPLESESPRTTTTESATESFEIPAHDDHEEEPQEEDNDIEGSGKPTEEQHIPSVTLAPEIEDKHTRPADEIAAEQATTKQPEGGLLTTEEVEEGSGVPEDHTLIAEIQPTTQAGVETELEGEGTQTPISLEPESHVKETVPTQIPTEELTTESLGDKHEPVTDSEAQETVLPLEPEKSTEQTKLETPALPEVEPTISEGEQPHRDITQKPEAQVTEEITQTPEDKLNKLVPPSVTESQTTVKSEEEGKEPSVTEKPIKETEEKETTPAEEQKPSDVEEGNLGTTTEREELEVITEISAKETDKPESMDHIFETVTVTPEQEAEITEKEISEEVTQKSTGVTESEQPGSVTQSSTDQPEAYTTVAEVEGATKIPESPEICGDKDCKTTQDENEAPVEELCTKESCKPQEPLPSSETSTDEPAVPVVCESEDGCEPAKEGSPVPGETIPKECDNETDCIPDLLEKEKPAVEDCHGEQGCASGKGTESPVTDKVPEIPELGKFTTEVPVEVTVTQGATEPSEMNKTEQPQEVEGSGEEVSDIGEHGTTPEEYETTSSGVAPTVKPEDQTQHTLAVEQEPELEPTEGEVASAQTTTRSDLEKEPETTSAPERVTPLLDETTSETPKDDKTETPQESDLSVSPISPESTEASVIITASTTETQKEVPTELPGEEKDVQTESVIQQTTDQGDFKKTEEPEVYPTETEIIGETTPSFERITTENISEPEVVPVTEVNISQETENGVTQGTSQEQEVTPALEIEEGQATESGTKAPQEPGTETPSDAITQVPVITDQVSVDIETTESVTESKIPEGSQETEPSILEGTAAPVETPSLPVTTEQSKAEGVEVPEQVLPHESEAPQEPTTSIPSEVAESTEQIPSERTPEEVSQGAIETETLVAVTESEAEITTVSEEHGIPGEGSCLVDGQTYKNNSHVPPINQCQTSCKCLSSILQCESIPCTPPPSNLQCVPIFHSQDACCPVYSCSVPGVTSMESDSHVMETTTVGESVTRVVPSEETATEKITTVKSEETTGEEKQAEVTEQLPVKPTEGPIAGEVTESSGTQITTQKEVVSKTESAVPESEIKTKETPVPETQTVITEQQTTTVSEGLTKPSEEHLPSQDDIENEIIEEPIHPDHCGIDGCAPAEPTELPEVSQSLETEAPREPQVTDQITTETEQKVPETTISSVTEQPKGEIPEQTEVALPGTTDGAVPERPIEGEMEVSVTVQPQDEIPEQTEGVKISDEDGALPGSTESIIPEKPIAGQTEVPDQTEGALPSITESAVPENPIEGETEVSVTVQPEPEIQEQTESVKTSDEQPSITEGVTPEVPVKEETDTSSTEKPQEEIPEQTEEEKEGALPGTTERVVPERPIEGKPEIPVTVQPLEEIPEQTESVKEGALPDTTESIVPEKSVEGETETSATVQPQEEIPEQTESIKEGTFPGTTESIVPEKPVEKETEASATVQPQEEIPEQTESVKEGALPGTTENIIPEKPVEGETEASATVQPQQEVPEQTESLKEGALPGTTESIVPEKTIEGETEASATSQPQEEVTEEPESLKEGALPGTTESIVPEEPVEGETEVSATAQPQEEVPEQTERVKEGALPGTTESIVPEKTIEGETATVQPQEEVPEQTDTIKEGALPDTTESIIPEQPAEGETEVSPTVQPQEEGEVPEQTESVKEGALPSSTENILPEQPVEGEKEVSATVQPEEEVPEQTESVKEGAVPVTTESIIPEQPVQGETEASVTVQPQEEIPEQTESGKVGALPGTTESIVPEKPIEGETEISVTVQPQEEIPEQTESVKEGVLPVTTESVVPEQPIEGETETSVTVQPQEIPEHTESEREGALPDSTESIAPEQPLEGETEVTVTVSPQEEIPEQTESEKESILPTVTESVTSEKPIEGETEGSVTVQPEEVPEQTEGLKTSDKEGELPGTTESIIPGRPVEGETEISVTKQPQEEIPEQTESQKEGSLPDTTESIVPESPVKETEPSITEQPAEKDLLEKTEEEKEGALPVTTESVIPGKPIDDETVTVQPQQEIPEQTESSKASDKEGILPETTESGIPEKPIEGPTEGQEEDKLLGVTESAVPEKPIEGETEVSIIEQHDVNTEPITIHSLVTEIPETVTEVVSEESSKTPEEIAAVPEMEEAVTTPSVLTVTDSISRETSPTAFEQTTLGAKGEAEVSKEPVSPQFETPGETGSTEHSETPYQPTLPSEIPADHIQTTQPSQTKAETITESQVIETTPAIEIEAQVTDKESEKPKDFTEAPATEVVPETTSRPLVEEVPQTEGPVEEIVTQQVPTVEQQPDQSIYAEPEEPATEILATPEVTEPTTVKFEEVTEQVIVPGKESETEPFPTHAPVDIITEIGYTSSVSPVTDIKEDTTGTSMISEGEQPEGSTEPSLVSKPTEETVKLDEGVTSTEKVEPIYTSPQVTPTQGPTNISELYTSGPKIEETTKKYVKGELSTSIPVTQFSTQQPSTAYPTYAPAPAPGHDIPGEQIPEVPEYPSQGEDYDDEDQSPLGPGTCRYGGKVYVSAQQIPRDDPCDFCFCFRSDIICLQQSCPPPIPRCHEEPIRGFCCPRYECPVGMATAVNVTTSTTTTTTTLPPHFLSHAYKGRVTKSGCQIKGRAYQVGDVIPSASGPCLQCTCGGDGEMKCDPKACSPEPMLRQMIAAAVSRRRR